MSDYQWRTAGTLQDPEFTELVQATHVGLIPAEDAAEILRRIRPRWFSEEDDDVSA